MGERKIGRETGGGRERERDSHREGNMSGRGRRHGWERDRNGRKKERKRDRDGREKDRETGAGERER